MNGVMEGSGNVYADLGYPDAKEMLVKAQLAAAINGIISAKELTQSQAAEILGMTQPKLSRILQRFRY